MSKPPAGRTCRFEVWVTPQLKASVDNWGSSGTHNCADLKRDAVALYDQLLPHPDLMAQVRLELALRTARAAPRPNGQDQHQGAANALV